MLGALYDGGLSMVNSAIESLGDWVIERLKNQLPWPRFFGFSIDNDSITQSLNQRQSLNRRLTWFPRNP